ncbi:MAG TPA: two-component regulator propeller domain-containing protein, partial [Saprospiraceae bacterium]|nr:two-component regulator propeller domain-containing protein [Saprospiraceae bacterium]
GLPQSQVLCAMTDTRGYLWLGTSEGGLCRFDGKTFEVFTTADGLPSNSIRAIHQSANYELIIGTNNGLCIYDGHQFSLVKGMNPFVNTLCFYNNGQILVGANEGLFLLDTAHDSIIKYADKDLGNVLSSYTDSSTTWVGSVKGLWKISSHDAQPEFIAKMIGQGVYAIAPSGKNKLWIGSWNAGLILYDVIKKQIDTVLRSALVQLPQSLLIHDDRLWIGTQNNGIALLNLVDSTLLQLSEKEGLPHHNVKAITKDANEQIWIATSGGGIAKCVKQNFRQYTRSDGLNANRVYATLVSNDKLWIAAGLGTVQLLDNDGITSFRLDSLINGVKCKTLAMDHAGRLWIGTEGKGLIVKDNNVFTQISTQNGLPDDWIQKIIVDKKGNVWAGSYTNGLVSLRLDSVGYTIQNHDLPFRRIGALFNDMNDRIWIGSMDGKVVCIKDDKIIWKSIAKTNLPAVPIRSFCVDHHNRIWIGTENSLFYGMTERDSISFETISLPHQLHSQNIYLLQLDLEGNIWAGTEKGVDKITLETNGEIQSISFYGKNEGFSGIETCHDAVSIDGTGTIWFGTMNGLIRYLPGEENRQYAAPRVHFESISLFYKPIQQTVYAKFSSSHGGLLPGLTLLHQDNHLSFNFRAIDLDHPDDIVYRWKLEGADGQWSPPSEQSGVNYASLSPGTYTLLVQAATSDLRWSEPITASFTIQSPFWQQPLFLIAGAIGLISLLVLVFYSWSRSLKRKESARRQQLELENKLLLLEQKALQLQMNPHFIFNALTSIKSLVAKEELASAQEEINAFAQLMRSVLNNSRRQNISLSEEISTLDKYLHLEQFCHQNKFEYSIGVDESIDPEEIEIPPMLLQPFVENAVVHGVGNLQYTGKINILFEKENEVLACTITDNGPGRERASRLREEKKPGHQSVAIEVTKERLEAMRNGFTYVPLSMQDVMNDANEISGTKVTVRIPMKGNW